jgi:EmrB/QacA subfamily drug resistance transporter
MTTHTNPDSRPGGAASNGAPAAPATAAAPQDSAAPVHRPYWGTTLVLLTGTFISVLDFFIVNVAIPSIQRDLHASSAGIEWVVAGFALAYGSGLIIGGRLGDIFGRRRLFVTGLTLFILSSALCGAAPDTVLLIIGRVVQGGSAALMAPQILTILGTTFAGPLRARAFNAYGVTMGLAAVFGQLIGGVLIQANPSGLEWRTCFLINIPIGLIALALVPRFVPESRAPGRPRLDFGGMILIALALTAIALPLIEGRQLGWPAWSWVSLGISVVLFGVFVLYESGVPGRGGSPLIDLTLFRERAFSAGLGAQLVFWTGQASYFLVFALYVQFGRGLGPLDAGLIFMAIGAGYMTTSTTARFVAAKIGRQVIALGGLLRIAGLLLLILALVQIGDGGNIGWLVPALVIDGAGQGLAVAPLATTVLSRVKPQHAGAAAGVLTTGIQVGNALGVAIVGIIFYSVLNHTHGVNAYAHAFAFSLIYVIFAAALLATLVQLLPRAPGGAK